MDTRCCEAELEKRFRAITHIHNVCVKHTRKLLVCLDHNREYQDLRKRYLEAGRELAAMQSQDTAKETVSSIRALEQLRKDLSKAMNAIRCDLCISKAGLEAWLKVCGKQFRHLVSSQQVQAEADRVWAGAEKCLFGSGKVLHYKKQDEILSISGKSNRNGAIFHPETMTVTWTGLELPIRLPKKESDLQYISESLNGTVAYCEIQKKAFPSGWRYYVNLCIRGAAPANGRTAGTGAMGIDPGTSTMAAVGEKAAFLEELAPDIVRYNREILDLQYHLERSRRTTNPGKYNPDGSINRKNRDRWIRSKAYRRNLQKLRCAYRKKAAYLKQDHEERANRFLAEAGVIYIEQMEYHALQKRSRQTVRKDTASEIRKKDGTIRTVHKFRRKKRFGRSLNNRAPASFLTILKRKAAMLCVPVMEIQTRTYKASQYDHVTGTCTKTPLSQRNKEISGHTVQRDLYSAFLIRNPDASLAHPDRKKCRDSFETFVTIHDNLISQMKASGLSRKPCFGF